MELAGRDLLFMPTITAKFHSWYKCPVIARHVEKTRLCKCFELSMGMTFISRLGRLLLTTVFSVLQRKKETRKRNLSFHLPAAVSCSPTLRLFQTDSSYVTLGDIYDLHCEEIGISREEPILFAGEKVKKTLREFRQNSTRQVFPLPYHGGSQLLPGQCTLVD